MEIVLLFTLSDRRMSPSVISGQCVIVYPFWPPTVIPCYKWRLCYCLPFLTAYCYLLLSVEIVLLFTLSDRLMSPSVISGKCVIVYPFWSPTVTPVISGQCVTVYPYWPPTVTPCYKWRLCYYLSFLTAYCHLLLWVEIVLLFILSDRLLSPSVISGECVTVYPFWPPTVTSCYKWRLCYCLSFLTAYCYLLL